MLKATVGMRIPHLIHQVWFGFTGPLEGQPEYYEPHLKTREFCKTHMIGYKLWNQKECEDLCREHHGALWNDFRYDIQRADFVRMVILQHYGGIYVDMDVYPIANIDKLFEAPELFVRWPGQKDCYNAIMGSHVGHPIWREAIHHCKESTYAKQQMEIYEERKGRLVSQTTGCAMLTRTLKKNKFNYDTYQEIVRVYNEKKGLRADPPEPLFQDGSVSGWFDKKHEKAHTKKWNI
jgi:hypothetical protein